MHQFFPVGIPIITASPAPITSMRRRSPLQPLSKLSMEWASPVRVGRAVIGEGKTLSALACIYIYIYMCVCMYANRLRFYNNIYRERGREIVWLVHEYIHIHMAAQQYRYAFCVSVPGVCFNQWINVGLDVGPAVTFMRIVCAHETYLVAHTFHLHLQWKVGCLKTTIP